MKTLFPHKACRLLEARSRRFALFAIALVGCSAQRHEKVAMEAVQKFHEDLASENYDSILKSADPAAMKGGGISRQTLERIHRNLNAPQTFWPRITHVSNMVMFDRVELQGETRFANGWGHEVFNWRVEGNRAVLESYAIEMAPGTPAIVPGWK